MCVKSYIVGYRYVVIMYTEIWLFWLVTDYCMMYQYRVFLLRATTDDLFYVAVSKILQSYT